MGNLSDVRELKTRITLRPNANHDGEAGWAVPGAMIRWPENNECGFNRGERNEEIHGSVYGFIS